MTTGHANPERVAEGHRSRPSAVAAVLLAGAIPTVLLNLTVVNEIDRDGMLLFDFLLHLLRWALGCGRPPDGEAGDHGSWSRWPCWWRSR